MLQLSLSHEFDVTTDRRQVCKHAVCGAVAPALLTSTSTRPVILSASAATCAFHFELIRCSTIMCQAQASGSSLNLLVIKTDKA